LRRFTALGIAHQDGDAIRSLEVSHECIRPALSPCSGLYFRGRSQFVSMSESFGKLSKSASLSTQSVFSGKALAEFTYSECSPFPID
jgi:hypothetical protein